MVPKKIVYRFRFFPLYTRYQTNSIRPINHYVLFTITAKLYGGETYSFSVNDGPRRDEDKVEQK